MMEQCAAALDKTRAACAIELQGVEGSPHSQAQPRDVRECSLEVLGASLGVQVNASTAIGRQLRIVTL